MIDQAQGLRPAADFFRLAFTLRLIDRSRIEMWAVKEIAAIDKPPAPLIELATLGDRDTESVLDELRKIPGQPDESATVDFLLALIGRRHFRKEDPVEFSVELLEALHFEFQHMNPFEGYLYQISCQWDGVIHGWGETEEEFLRDLSLFLHRFDTIAQPGEEGNAC